MATPDTKVAHSFSGSRQDVVHIRTFLQELLIQFTLKDVLDDTKKIAYLAVNLTGSALDWYIRFSDEHDVSIMSYPEFLDYFTNMFAAQVETYDVIDKLSELKQRHSVEDYTKEFDRCRLLLPNYCLDDIAILSLYLKELKPSIRTELRLRSITTYYKATLLANRAERCALPSTAFLKPSTVLQSAPTPFPVDADGDVIMSIQSQNNVGQLPRSKGRQANARSSGKRQYAPNPWGERFQALCMVNGLYLGCGISGHSACTCTESPLP